MSFQPGSITAAERGGDMTPAYGYLMKHVNDGNTVFFTNWTTPFSLENVPASFSPGSPQEFTPMAIGHSTNTMDAEFARKTTDVTVQSDNDTLQQYFLTAAAVKITITIIRLNTERLLEPGVVLDWEQDVQLVNSGLIGMVSMSGQQITAQLTPEPHLTNQRVGRYFYQRGCNWILGGPGCKLDLAAFKHTTTIAALDNVQRIVTLTANPIPAVNADYFRFGYFKELSTGLMFPIQWTDLTGPGGTIRLKLSLWSPLLQVGQTLDIFPGCRHTTADCTTKFGNIANYGGFSRVPNKNPVYHSAL